MRTWACNHLYCVRLIVVVCLLGSLPKLVVAISGGGSPSLALNSDGTVVAWGNSQTNVPAGLTNIIAIACGSHSLALRADGTVVAWGDNSSGQANVPAGLTNVVAIAGGVM